MVEALLPMQVEDGEMIRFCFMEPDPGGGGAISYDTTVEPAMMVATSAYIMAADMNV